MNSIGLKPPQKDLSSFRVQIGGHRRTRSGTRLALPKLVPELPRVRMLGSELTQQYLIGVLEELLPGLWLVEILEKASEVVFVDRRLIVLAGPVDLVLDLQGTLQILSRPVEVSLGLSFFYGVEKTESAEPSFFYGVEKVVPESRKNEWDG